MTEQANQEELLSLLRQVTIFSRCSDYELKVVARRLTVTDVPAGTQVITQGEDSTLLYLVLSGSAEARIGGQVRDTLGPGSVFGELGALVAGPRTADVVTTTDARLASLGREQIYTLLDAIPGVARKMLEGMAGSLRSKIEAG